MEFSSLRVSSESHTFKSQSNINQNAANCREHVYIRKHHGPRAARNSCGKRSRVQHLRTGYQTGTQVLQGFQDRSALMAEVVVYVD